MKKVILLITTVLFLSNLCYAQEEIIFTGIPEIRISESGISRTPEDLSENEATEYKCIITKIDNKYYWTTREHVELIPVANGAFTTFLASNGAGYVRILNPEFKVLLPNMSEAEQAFDYVEHILLGLRTISYYGKSE